MLGRSSRCSDACGQLKTRQSAGSAFNGVRQQAVSMPHHDNHCAIMGR